MATRTAERTTILPAAPANVWEVLMSPEIAPIIDPSVREWKPDREPVGLGTRFSLRGRFGLVPIRVTSEVVQWEPPQVATFVSRKGSGPVRVTASHTLEAEGERTRYTWSVRLEGPGLMAAASASLFGRVIERQQRTLGAYLERS